MTSPAYQSGPTVVLVHGALADAGSWAPVTERLVAADVPVMAIVNPLRGVKSDAAYVASVINQIPGPVLAVGHSYGGMIITNAVPHTRNVVGLVYVAAFAPDEGETLAGIVGRSQDSVLTTAVLEKQFPVGEGPETTVELIIDQARFREVFTADLTQLESDVYGLSQRRAARAVPGVGGRRLLGSVASGGPWAAACCSGTGAGCTWTRSASRNTRRRSAVPA